MKKKNFLRNLSTTSLAICSLSSALALPSYACLLESERLENGDYKFKYIFSINSPVDSDTSAEPVDLVSNFQKTVINSAKLEPVNTDAKAKSEPVNTDAKAKSEPVNTDTSNKQFFVKKIEENDNGVVVIPEQIGLADNFIRITRVNSDVDLPCETNTMIIHNNVDYDKDNIINNHPGISILRYKPGEGLFPEFNRTYYDDDCDRELNFGRIEVEYL